MLLRGLVLIFFLVEVISSDHDKVYISNQTERANFYDAYARCIGKGLELPVVKDRHFNDKLTSAAATWGPNAAFWISGKTEGSNFTWFPRGKKMLYTNWGTGYPLKGRGHCVLLMANGKWENDDCTQRARFMCVAKEKEHKGLFEWIKDHAEEALQCTHNALDDTIQAVTNVLKRLYYLDEEEKQGAKRIGNEIIHEHQKLHT